MKDIEPLRAFVFVRVATDYDKLRKAIKPYDSMQKTFFVPASNSAGSSVGGSSAQDALDQQAKTEPRLLVRPDTRVKSIESKLDSLTDQIANLTLMMKKSSSNHEVEKKKVSWKDSD